MSEPARPAVRTASASSGDREFDVLVVGGGINGTGIARDLAGRGWRVCLAEQDDLAAHTSSASTKLIHGGLRYLEHLEFGLVRKALREREVLLRSAPHIAWPLRFVMPHDRSMRPAWLIRAGLFLYDHLARRELLPGTEALDLRSHPAGRPLRDHYARGFAYSDGWVDDARLVVLNAIDARERGATVLTRTRCDRAERSADGWTAHLRAADGGSSAVRARLLVNAAGPWAEQFLKERVRAGAGPAPRSRHLRLVKGSHVVVRHRFGHPDAYILQTTDGRIVFAIPYENDFTLVGTTDVEVQEAAGVRIGEAEIAYLCDEVSRYLRQPITPGDVMWSYAGVRPLLDDASDDPSAVTRDYLLETDRDGAPLLTVWGGKLTTYRTLSEEAANEACRLLGAVRPPWTRHAFLPGGDLSPWVPGSRSLPSDFEQFAAAAAVRHRALPEALVRRYARAYGTRMERVMAFMSTPGDPGEEIAPGLFEAELRYLVAEEWARETEDVLWRRSKLGLRCSPAEVARVATWLRGRTG